MNKKIIAALMVMVLSIVLFAVPAFAATVTLNAYQVDVRAIAIHNKTDGRWYLLNSSAQNIDANVASFSWVGSQKLKPGTYDKVGILIGENVKFNAQYADSGVDYYVDGSNYQLATLLHSGSTGSGNIDTHYSVANSPGSSPIVFSAPDAFWTDNRRDENRRYITTVPSNDATSYFPSLSGDPGQYIKSVSDFTITDTLNITVNWDTTDCISIDTGTADGDIVHIGGFRPPLIGFQVTAQ